MLDPALEAFEDLQIDAAFREMPTKIRKTALRIRGLIFEVARQRTGCEVREALKWGQPSYSTPRGSPVRLGWKPTAPHECSVLFHCQSKLVDTFKELYPNRFQYDGNRAIVLGLDEPIAEQELKHCIELALNYHRLKHLPLLGC